MNIDKGLELIYENIFKESEDYIIPEKAIELRGDDGINQPTDTPDGDDPPEDNDIDQFLISFFPNDYNSGEYKEFCEHIAEMLIFRMRDVKELFGDAGRAEQKDEYFSKQYNTIIQYRHHVFADMIKNIVNKLLSLTKEDLNALTDALYSNYKMKKNIGTGDPNWKHKLRP